MYVRPSSFCMLIEWLLSVNEALTPRHLQPISDSALFCNTAKNAHSSECMHFIFTRPWLGFGKNVTHGGGAPSDPSAKTLLTGGAE